MIFEQHLDFHFQSQEEKPGMIQQKTGRFIDKNRFQQLSFNFIPVQGQMNRNSRR